MATAISMPEQSAVAPLRKLSTPHLIAISLFWFAVNAHWAALLVVVIAAHVRLLAGDQGKEAALALVLTPGAAIAMVVPLIAGALSDRSTSRWGRRRPFIFWFTLLNCAGLAAMMFAPSLPVLLAAYLAVQFSNNVAGAAYNGVIPDMVPGEQRGVASGWMGVMTMLGNVTGALVCGALLAQGSAGIVPAYSFLIILLLLFLIPTLLAIRERQVPPLPKLNWGDWLRSLWIDPRKYPDFAWVFITRLMVTMGIYTVLNFIQYYLHDVIGIENAATESGNLVGVLTLAAIVPALAAGSLSDRFGRKRVVYLAGLIMACMSLAFVLVNPLASAAATIEGRMLPVLVIAAIFGIGYGAYISVDWALGTECLPSQHGEEVGKEMGIWHISMVLPQVIAPLLAGIILSQFVPYKQFLTGYTVLFATAVVYFFLGGLLVSRVRKVR